MPTPAKTIQVRVEIPEELHAKLSQEADEDERTLSVYIVRVLRGLKPRAAAPTRQPVFQPTGLTGVTLDPRVDSNPLAEPLPEPLAPTDDLPIEQWDDMRLVNTLQQKRAESQAEKARITTIAHPKEQEAAKAGLERAITFIGVLEREFMKRRGKQERKPPSPPRANPQRVS